MSKTAILKLASSSKASVMVATMVALSVLVYLGRLDGQQMLDTVKILLPSWFLAHAGEQGAKHLANGKAPIVAPIGEVKALTVAVDKLAADSPKKEDAKS
jgi:hypothetical protein